MHERLSDIFEQERSTSRLKMSDIFKLMSSNPACVGYARGGGGDVKHTRYIHVTYTLHTRYIHVTYTLHTRVGGHLQIPAFIRHKGY